MWHVLFSDRLEELGALLLRLSPLAPVEILPHLRAATVFLSTSAVGRLRRVLAAGEILEESRLFHMSEAEGWHLARVRQRERVAADARAPEFARGGQGKRIYILDTGIAPHPEFEDRLLPGFNSSRSTSLFSLLGLGGQNTSDTVDRQGHGTHVASLAAGRTTGTSRASLVPVKVLNDQGSGSTDSILRGIDYVLGQQTPGAVVNASLGGGVSEALDEGFRRLRAAGYVVVVAAGNENSNASTSSPARVAEVITVGCCNISDRRSSFSNYGAGVDLFAPGENVTGAWLNGTYNTISGTSMSAPVVAGILASAADPASLVSQATRDALSDTRGSPNLLAYFA